MYILFIGSSSLTYLQKKKKVTEKMEICVINVFYHRRGYNDFDLSSCFANLVYVIWTFTVHVKLPV